MEESHTIFSVVKASAVYVVQDVPCFQCPQCENASFTQETTRMIERLTSGRVLPHRILNAWVYEWGSPVVEISRGAYQQATENRIYVRGGTASAPF
jgi:hypothetical protein